MTWEICQRDSERVLPRILPSGWEHWGPSAGGFASTSGLRVLSSVVVDREQDGRRWHHVSASRANRLPSWEDMCEVKELFVGLERKGIQIFPPRSEYCNGHPFCLHLWSCLDDVAWLPDFRFNGRI